ncbi:hypothetical protein B0H14DRAFT_2782285 [Mycena olivaceomarginata]|nr:hypothetical protein B0H14DRAFT_2782285 [Mycena olivaceomarginata]
MRRSIQLDQTLTATHDHAAAWAGIGAAVSSIWHQKAVTASIGGVLSIFLYLGNILVLHITTPALFSLETFTSPVPIPVGTQSLPDFNRSLYDPPPFNISQNYTENETFNEVLWTAFNQLYFLPSVAGDGTNLGLNGGTLFDVLDFNSGSGNATVKATGFNFSCGYLTDVDKEFTFGGNEWEGNWTLNGENTNLRFFDTEFGIIKMPGTDSDYFDIGSVILYSTIPILDSNGDRGGLVNLQPSSVNFLSVSAVQIFQCSFTLVNQSAVVDAQSHQIQAVEPDLLKFTSTWTPYTEPMILRPAYNYMPDNIFDMFILFWEGAPATDIPLNVVFVAPGETLAPDLNVVDVYLAQKLNLLRATNETAGSLALHDVENALSELIAATFWTVGHLPPVHGLLAKCGNGVCIKDILNWCPLLRGTATSVTEIITLIRLDLSIIAVAAGLVASIALFLLSLPTSAFYKGGKDDRDILIDGTGLLHAIWMCRNHTELEALLPQVENPTINNLREAGMIRTRLVSGVDLRRRRRCDSF